MTSIPQRESDYDVVDDVTSGMRFRVILAPGGGVAGTGSVDVENYANGSLIAQAIEAWLVNNLLEGSGMSIDRTVPGQLTLIVTAGAGSYTDEQVRNVIGSALVGTGGRVVVDPDDPGNLIVVDLDPVFVARVAALEASRSEVQSKENTASGGGATNYMNFPAGANYVDTPSSSAFNVAGDSTWVGRVKMPAATPASDWCVYARRGADAAHTQFSTFIETTGQFHMTNSVNGTSTVSTPTTAATTLVFDGNWIWIRQSREASTGQIDFYTAPDTGSDDILPAAWTTFQLNRGNQIGTLFAAPQPIEINGFNNGASATLATGAQVGRFIMISSLSIAGTVIADANAHDYVSGTSWTGPSGNVWTLRGSATIVLTGGGANSGTTKYVLGDTDANTGVALHHFDVIYFWDQGGLLNSSGAGVTFAFEVVVNNVVLTTITPPALASVAASVYRYEFTLTIEMSSTTGTTQIYSWTLRIYDAVAGTFIGSQTSSAILHDRGGGWSGALSTFTTLPKIELKLTQGAGGSSGHVNSRVALQRA